MWIPIVPMPQRGNASRGVTAPRSDFFLDITRRWIVQAWDSLAKRVGHAKPEINVLTASPALKSNQVFFLAHINEVNVITRQLCVNMT